MCSTLSLMVLFLSITSIAYVKSSNASTCFLNVTTDSDDMEPTGNPLDIELWMDILHIRDVPNSGGSYSVDLK